MITIRRAYILAGLAVNVLAYSAQVVHAQNAPNTSSYSTDVAEEDAFHRLEELDRKREKYPKAIPTQEWQTAFCGWNDDAPRPQYLGTLFGEYARVVYSNKRVHKEISNEQYKQLTIKWIETLADELVQRGDARMFLLLASHYVDYGNAGFYSKFSAPRFRLGQGMLSLGTLLRKSLATLSPEDRDLFKKDLAIAIGEQLVIVQSNDASAAQAPDTSIPEVAAKTSNGIMTAILGYELLTKYADGDDALRALDDVVKKGTFQEEDLQGLFTLEGARDFTVVASGFLKGLTAENSPLTHLFKLGLRVNKATGDSMRNMFIDAIKINSPKVTFDAINFVYRLAAEQRYAGMSDTMAQQMQSAIWTNAVADIMTLKQIKEILLQHYLHPNPYTPQTFHIARRMQFTAAQEPEMLAVYVDVLRATAKTPKAYYALINDFPNNEVFKKALAQEDTKLVSQNILSHFSYNASVYISDISFSSNVDSYQRMADLMRRDKEMPVDKRVTTTAFQRAVMQMARDIKGDGNKANQLAKILSNAVNTWDIENPGWSKHISKGFIDMVRKTLSTPKDSLADEQLDSVLKVLDYHTQTLVDKKTRDEADKRAAVRAWKPVIKRIVPQR